jgi:hypothetical protein
MSHSNVKRFKQKLEEQINFIRSSCQAFDNGNKKEALRIATSIRVILHDTPQSTSILKHLNAKDINLFTIHVEPPKPPEDMNGYMPIHAFSMGVINLGGTDFGYGPNLEDFSPGKSRVLPVDEWWNEIIWIISLKSGLTRKRLVLSAANQDGGAHVDNQLNEHYDNLASADFGSISIRTKSISFQWPIKDMHLVAIRTIANELIKSPELLRLIQ